MSTNDRSWERIRKSSLRKEIYERDNYMCVYCGVRVNKTTATLDHIVPKSLCNDHSPSNLVTACRACNSRKGTKPLYKFLSILVLELDQPTYVIIGRVNQAIAGA